MKSYCESPRGSRRECPGSDRGRAPASRVREWANTTARVAQATDQAARSADAVARGGLCRSAATRSRQEPVRDRACGNRVRERRIALRAQAPRLVGTAEARAYAVACTARAELDPAGTEGRRADHRALELPGVDGVCTAGRGDRGWQRSAPEAVGDHLARLGDDRATRSA